MAALVAALAVASTTWAAPSDDHQRAVVAYQRGDVVDAMRLLRPAAAAGHASSQTLLAFILDRADAPEEAARLYGQAAAQGDAEAMSSLAALLLVGRGVAKDEKQALEHFSKAARLGHKPSIVVVAEAHLRGSVAGTTPEPAQTLDAVKRAADVGHLASAQALASAYRSGGMGLAPDASQASAWDARVVALRRELGLPAAERTRR